jgi:hypothetical protein
MRTPLPEQTLDPFMSRSFLLLPASPSARGRAIGKRPHFDGGSPPRRLVSWWIRPKQDEETTAFADRAVNAT